MLEGSPPWEIMGSGFEAANEIFLQITRKMRPLVTRRDVTLKRGRKDTMGLRFMIGGFVTLLFEGLVSGGVGVVPIDLGWTDGRIVLHCGAEDDSTLLMVVIMMMAPRGIAVLQEKGGRQQQTIGSSRQTEIATENFLLS